MSDRWAALALACIAALGTFACRDHASMGSGEESDSDAVPPLPDAGSSPDPGLPDAGSSRGDAGGLPPGVTSCADLGLPGFCIDVYTSEELVATHDNCPLREVCRVVVHPGRYDNPASLFTYHHWYRHYIGVIDADGKRPLITSKVGSVFANKGSKEVQQNTILQNLELGGSVMGVDFDGATGDPYFDKGGLSWLHNVKIDAQSREILFNTGPNPGGGSFWCTDCELIHRPSPGNPSSMVAISQIDSAWFSNTRFIDESRNDLRSVKVEARSRRFENNFDKNGGPANCDHADLTCEDGPTPELLRAPTLEWFESLVYAQPH